MKAERDTRRVREALDRITDCCSSGEGSLMTLAVEAAQVRATVGEITGAMEKVWGRHQATDRLVSGAYKTEYGEDKEMQAVMGRIQVVSSSK